MKRIYDQTKLQVNTSVTECPGYTVLEQCTCVGACRKDKHRMQRCGSDTTRKTSLPGEKFDDHYVFNILFPGKYSINSLREGTYKFFTCNEGTSPLKEKSD